VQWTNAVLYNALGRYEHALAAARQTGEDPQDRGWWVSTWGMAELIEAATRGGVPEHAADALEQLSESTRASGSDWALGIEACARALLSVGDTAERLYREALDRLGRTRIRMALARAHLLFGEWLCRENRRTDGREQLRTAHRMFLAMGAEGFAERARRELPTRARLPASAPSRPAAGSLLRRPRSPSWPAKACLTSKSAPGCSSVRGPPSITWVRSSRSSPLAPVTNFMAFRPTAETKYLLVDRGFERGGHTPPDGDGLDELTHPFGERIVGGVLLEQGIPASAELLDEVAGADHRRVDGTQQDQRLRVP
jgi:hypothetical protein